jgi:alkanesulfonate monooxygenase SsuD/methylene tetrahydromethanopterin reductase-like flavin-dependent oxidoreductase (luciferase family)
MMATYFKTPGFGTNLHTGVRPEVDLVAEALYAEQLGFDVVTIHRDALHGSDPSFEIWTLLTWLAARTSRTSHQERRRGGLDRTVRE